MTNEEINKYVDMGDIEKDEEITTERAIAEVYRWIRVVEHESYEYENLTPKVLNMAIKALEQEPKTGHWIKETPFLIAECSECGNKAFGNHGFDEVLTKYCPNCGARMRKESEEEI